MARDFKGGDMVRRRVDGKIMVIVYTGMRGRGDWKCAWMDGHLRHTDEFTEYEIEHHEPNTIEGTATRVDDARALLGDPLHGVSLGRKANH